MTKEYKDKLFKLVKANNNIEIIKRMRDELKFKNAKIYLTKMDNLSLEDVLKNRDFENFKRLIEEVKDNFKI
ncbi:MAG: hypothetical protein LGB73_02545 [Sulfurovum sp.]|nr:hypothetical protein [Sulfurovum sp.]